MHRDRAMVAAMVLGALRRSEDLGLRFDDLRVAGDAVAAMVDRLVHHAEIINLKGESYRLKDRRKDLTTE